VSGTEETIMRKYENSVEEPNLVTIVKCNVGTNTVDRDRQTPPMVVCTSPSLKQSPKSIDQADNSHAE
jgi:hypothetical protein